MRFLIHRLIDAALMACVFLSLGAIFGRFVPSHLGSVVALAIAVPAGIAVAFWTVFDPRYQPGYDSYREFMSRRGAFGSAPTRAVLIGVFATFFVFMAINGVGLQALTRVIGSRGEATMHVGELKAGSRRTCAGVDFVEPIFTLQRICIDDGSPAPPPGSAVVLYGTVSPFGVDMERYRFPR